LATINFYRILRSFKWISRIQFLFFANLLLMDNGTPFRLKFMCLNGVAVEVKSENLKFNPNGFFLFFFSMEIWNGSLLVQLHWLFNYIQWVINFFLPCRHKYIQYSKTAKKRDWHRNMSDGIHHLNKFSQDYYHF
jgi:hypothetical protein